MNHLEGMKQCSKCGEMFPASPEFFGRNKNVPGGLAYECRICSRERAARYRAADPDKAREISRRYRDANRGKLRENSRVYQKANREKVRVLSSRWKAANPDKVRLYRKAHAKQGAIYSRRRRARKRALLNTFTPNDWKRCLEYWGDCCAVCGRHQSSEYKIAADHWFPLSYDGPDNPGTVPHNIVPLCHGIGGCNNSKNNTLPDEWLADIYGKRKARAILRRVQDYFEWVRSSQITLLTNNTEARRYCALKERLQGE